MIKTLSLFILIFSPLSVFAQIDTLTVNENNEEIKIVLSSVNQADQMQELNRIYTDKGFFEVEIMLIDSVYHIQTGPRFKISKISFTQEDESSFIISGLSNIEYSTEIIQKNIEDYYEELIDAGYRNAILSIESVEFDTLSKNVSISVDIKKGELVRTSRILFTGNRVNS